MTSPIGWCNITINPITGCSNFGNKKICGDYCYAARMAKRLRGRFGYPADDPFRPAFHPDKLDHIRRIRGEGKRVFLDSMGDWFSLGVMPAWIHRAIQVVYEKPEHHFLVLTKRPERIQEMLHCVALPENLWFGVSVTCQEELWRIKTLDEALPKVTHKFVSFEPILGPIDPDLDILRHVEWCILGAETGPRAKLHERDWIDDLVTAISQNQSMPIFMKSNLSDVHHTEPWMIIEQFPEEMV